MDFELTADEREWRGLARQLADEWIRPTILEKEWEPDPADRVPWDAIEAASDMGIRTCTVPPEYGGPERPVSSLAMALIIEEIATADPGVAIYFNHTMKDIRQITRLASQEQKDDILPRFVADSRFLMAHAATEPAHGGDRYLPPEDFRFDTVARLDGDEWVINGRKHCISAAVEASIVLVQASTDDEAGYTDGTTLFIVPGDAPGLVRETVHPKAGLRRINNAEVVLNDCRIPAANVLGRVNGAIAGRRGQMNDNGLLSMAQKLGIARSALEDTLAHARTRVQGGKPIIEHQAVAVKVAEMHAQVESIRSMMLRYAWMNDHPESFDKSFTEGATWLAVEAAFRVCTLGVQVAGCQGAWLDHTAQKHLRDSMMYFPNDGTHGIHLLILARLLEQDTSDDIVDYWST
jgi:alkylation response protein AidB-like acyl-CoA dehydrogenase